MDSDDNDLSLIPPHKRDEVRRRIRVLNSYLKAPSVKAANASAADLGLSLSSFYNLARAWKAARADMLPGAGRPRQRKDELTSDQRSVLEKVAKESSAKHLERSVEDALSMAKQLEVVMPSVSSIRRHLRRMTLRDLPADSFAFGSMFAVDHVAVDLPVEDGDRVTMPVAAIVMRMEDAQIVGCHLTLEGPSPDSVRKALFYAGLIRSEETNEEVSLALEAYPTDDWKVLTAELAQMSFHLTVSERKSLGRKGPALLLPESIQGIKIKPRLAAREQHRRQPTVPAGAMPLTIEDANELVRARWRER